jgi:hypothetical protein
MEASKTGAAYEASLAEAHRLGVFPYLHDVAQVARAGLHAD